MATQYKVKIDASKFRWMVVEALCKYLDSVKRDLRDGAPICDNIDVIQDVVPVKKRKGGKHVA